MNKAFAVRKIFLAVAAAAASFSPVAQAVDWVWSTGNFVPGTTAPSPLVAPDTLSINAGLKTFGGVAWENQAAVLWNADDIRFISSNVVNSGTWDAKSDNSFVYAGGGASSFVNNGTFRKSAGAGVTRASANNVSFINSGTVDAQTGIIEFFSGNDVFNNGTQFTGSGVNRIASNATFNGSFSSSNLVLAGGSYTGGGLTGAALNGAVDWTGGSFASVWQVAAGQTLRGKTGIDKTFAGATFTNAGTLSWQTTDNLRFVSSNVTNSGLVDLQNDANLVYASGGASTFTNTGTFRKSGGASSSIQSANINFINDAGVIDAQSGIIDFAGGSATFNTGTQFVGAGVNKISNNATFNGAITSANLQLAAGTFSAGGAGAVVSGAVSWSGGAFANAWQLAAGQTLTAQAGIDKTFAGATFTNAGTLSWQTTDNLRFVSSNVTNSGLVDLQNDANLVYASGGASTFTNTGTFRKSGGASSSIQSANINFINDAGVIHAQTGTIDFAGGSATFNAGTQFTGAGVNRVSSHATFNGEFNSANLLLAGGIYTGGNAVLKGSVAWTGGAFSNAWRVAPAQTLAAASGNSKTFSGVSFVNDGTLLWQTADDLRFVSSNFTNNSLVDLQDGASLTYAGGGASNFVNNGVLRKSGGGTSSVSANINFTNPGVLDVRTGTFVLPANFVNPGTIMGAGTVQSNVLTNLGHVAPGNSPGILTLTGSYVQTVVGTLDIEVENLGSFDLLQVSGAASLAGTLAVACFGACSFVVGDEFVILTAGGIITGTFDGNPVLTGFATGDFVPIYGLNDVRLRVTETVTAVPEPHTWALLLAGLGLVGWAARRRCAS